MIIFSPKAIHAKTIHHNSSKMHDLLHSSIQILCFKSSHFTYPTNLALFTTHRKSTFTMTSIASGKVTTWTEMRRSRGTSITQRLTAIYLVRALFIPTVHCWLKTCVIVIGRTDSTFTNT